VGMVEAVLGADLALRRLERRQCRDLLETLSWLPANYARRLPGFSLQQAVALAKAGGRRARLSPASVNGYMLRLGALLNVAISEGVLTRNPAKGLRLVETGDPRDHRRPFSDPQLQAIFAAPLYAGCVTDASVGDAKPGPASRRGGRFWLPLIGLYCGMRLNEISQLDLADVQRFDSVDCFVVSRWATSGASDKRVKSAGGERIVPVHPMLAAIGFMAYVERRRREGGVKLFPDLRASPGSGYYSDPLSKWFRRFLETSGAEAPKTSFHSFRHNFRDALRAGHVAEDLALALGGWATPGGPLALAGRGYGSRPSVGALAAAIARVRVVPRTIKAALTGANRFILQ